MDFYFAITNSLLYDKNSHHFDYEKEYYFLKELWKRCDEGKATNFSILFLRIAENALDTEFRFTEAGRSIRQVIICKMTIVVGDGIKRIRHLVWDSLFQLRKNPNYKKAVDEIIVRRHVKGLSEETTRELVLFDFNEIYPYIESDIDFQAAIIIDNYRIDIETLCMDRDVRSLRSNENEKFRIYSLLTREHIIGRTIEEDELLRKKSIKLEIKDYTIKDFKRLFSIYDTLCYEEPQKQYQMSGGISTIFECLEDEPSKYVDCINSFFSISGKLTNYGKYRIIDYLIKNIGYDKTKVLINNTCNSTFAEWMYRLWECVPDKSITNLIANDFFDFLYENENVVPDHRLLSKYANYDTGIVAYISERLLSNKQFAHMFLSGIISDEDVNGTITLFANKIIELSQMYISTLDYNIDYEGKLFKELYNRHPLIWEQYVAWLKDNFSYDNYEQNMIEVIWTSDDYKKKISYAFSILSDDSRITNRDVALLFFGKGENTIIEERKRTWLLNELNDSKNDFEKSKKLVYIVMIAYPEWEVEYVIEFSKLNDSIDDFKSLYLLSLFRSWSGSEIPLINKRIDFLSKLKNQLKGLKYLEHRLYLEECINDEERYKEKVELSEYIESSIYA